MFLKGGQDPNSNQYQEIGRLLRRAAMTREEQKKKETSYGQLYNRKHKVGNEVRI